jgi:hypothetical protein
MSDDEKRRARLEMGHAWMMCNECGAKLYDFDGHEDKARACPYVKDEKGRCTDKLKEVPKRRGA